MSHIKNLIFDLGGVVYDIRYENIAEAFLAHGVTNLSGIYSRTFQTHEMDLYEEGLISSDEVRRGLQALANAPLTDQEVDDILNAILIDLPPHRISLLLALKQKYRVILYSNTNDINYQFFTRQMMREYGFDVFSRCFHKAYFSHILHLRKPKPDGFRQILLEQGLKPEETLFIDDNEPNLAGARTVGIHGLWLQPGRDIQELFDERFQLVLGE